MAAQENVARWQVQVENLKAEKELLKNQEKRLRLDLESIRREQSSQTLLMTSLQAIQVTSIQSPCINISQYIH